MTTSTFAPAFPVATIPLPEWLPWRFRRGLFCCWRIYFVGAEQGATSLISGKYVHEFVHDGRHRPRLSLSLTDC